MVHVSLPLMGVEGEWSASGAERALAARLYRCCPQRLRPELTRRLGGTS